MAVPFLLNPLERRGISSEDFPLKRYRPLPNTDFLPDLHLIAGDSQYPPHIAALFICDRPCASTSELQLLYRLATLGQRMVNQV